MRAGYIHKRNDEGYNARCSGDVTSQTKVGAYRNPTLLRRAHGAPTKWISFHVDGSYGETIEARSCLQAFSR